MSDSSPESFLEIHWPARYQPRVCPVHVRNAGVLAAAPDQVWACLIRAPLWPTWYRNSANVRILEPGVSALREGIRFRWRTFGVTITSTVLEFVPQERLAWDARAPGVDAYHAWTLLPAGDGCHVLTEETQRGWLATLSHRAMPGRMHKYHQVWLEALERQARGNGEPDGSRPCSSGSRASPRFR
jgi:uncharacterized protein YndB with AHSA1/START domain